MNKRSVVVDLADAAARAGLKRLIAEADVLVQNMRPGVLEPFQLDADAVRARYRRIIYCSVGAFGARGPLKSSHVTSRWCRPLRA